MAMAEAGCEGSAATNKKNDNSESDKSFINQNCIL
jgi:hypothetical protein